MPRPRSTRSRSPGASSSRPATGSTRTCTRTFNNLGRPIEVINSLNLLAAARIHLIDAIVHYDQAQFRLWVSLGSPPPLVETSTPDQPPVPEYLVP